MKLEILSQFDKINEQEWDDLLSQSAVNVPFLTFGYQRTWWEHNGGGEWPQAELRIITAMQDKELVGIAPLFVSTRNGKAEIHFVGSIEISDYLDFIVLPQFTLEFISSLFQLIKEDKAHFPGAIQLFNIPESSPSLEVFREINKGDDWSIEIERAYHTPEIALSDNWDTYLAGVDKKQRHEIRRKLRRATESDDDVKWYIVSDKRSLEQEIADFLSLMEIDDKKKQFLTDAMRMQINAIIHWAFDAGYLQLSFLTINEEKAAGYLCFDYEGKIYVYNSGFSYDYQYYSPGWVLLSFLIQHAIETRKSHFDFLRGDENYKYKFGAIDSFVMKVKAELNHD
ncbi:MAG: GNAT family N-acetyltransferase [Pelolinea sp.]|nr:GNAT family N-acetyltransferase [Pelolinea sp.]